MKILGREPAVYIAVIESLLALLVTFQLDGLSADQAALILAAAVAIGGLLASFATADALLAALSGAVKAVLVLGTAYGLSLTQDQIGMTAVLVSTVAGVFLRTQTSPVETALTSA